MIKQRTYTNKDCARFVKEAEDAGLEVRHYYGRYNWEGPAVYVDYPEAAQEDFSVACQVDNMGLQYVVYPRARDTGEENDGSL